MPNQDNNRKQTIQYDKIIKENLEVTLPVIIRDILGLDIHNSEELPDDIQHTKERKPDALKKVTDTKGNTYVLQIEFQVEDEKKWYSVWRNIILCSCAGINYLLNNTLFF